MHRSIKIAFIFLCAASSSALAGDNDLFSKVRVDSVFTNSNESSADKAAAKKEEKSSTSVAGIGHLSDLARSAGFEVKEESSRSISTSLQISGWSVPVLMTLSEDKSEIAIALLLRTVKDETDLSTGRLLALLNANRTHAPAFFAFSPIQKRTELHRIVKNRGITSETLESTVRNLGDVANETSSLWQAEATTAPKPDPSSPRNRAETADLKSNPVEIETSSKALLGNWSAVRSESEAFAIQLNSNGTFVLVHVASQQQNRSTGNFTLEGETLTLSSDTGAPISATISLQSPTEFHFLPKNAAKETAKLIFKKAN